jgi:hypothetical protein
MRGTWKIHLPVFALAFLLMAFPAGGKETFLIAVASDDKEAASLVSDFAARSRYSLVFILSGEGKGILSPQSGAYEWESRMDYIDWERFLEETPHLAEIQPKQL